MLVSSCLLQITDPQNSWFAFATEFWDNLLKTINDHNMSGYQAITSVTIMVSGLIWIVKEIFFLSLTIPS